MVAEGAEAGKELRRSPRVVCRVAVLLRPVIQAHTAVISQHGAMVLSPQDWPTGTILEMKNQKTGRASKCHVVWQGGEHRPGLYKLGVEMLDSRPDFWGTDYQPAEQPKPAEQPVAVAEEPPSDETAASTEEASS